MDLVLQLNNQLKEMEKELESLIQLKQASVDDALSTVIPTMTTVLPSTLVASLAPTAPMTTTLPTSTPTKSATGFTAIGSTSDIANKLVKAMEEMSLHTTEMNTLKEKVTVLKANYKLAQIMHKEEQQKATRMTKRIKSLEKELTLNEPLVQTKEHLWANLIDFVNGIWPSIQVIFEQIDLMKHATEAIQRVKEEPGYMPKEVARIIYLPQLQEQVWATRIKDTWQDRYNFGSQKIPH